MPFQAPRGTQDVLPSQSHQWQWIEREFIELTRLYGYKEIRTPVFEDTDLFVRTSGETSDIVSKQMYSFKDKGDRDITLKPEGTAPAIRAVIEHSLLQQGTTLRLSYVTPIYRYERPQKGRLREAHQVGLELIGSSSPAADAEVIEITVLFYQRLGLTDLNVLINSLGRDECRARYREAILHHAESFLKEQPTEVQDKVRKNPLRLLDSKDPEVQAFIKNVPSVLEFLEDESKAKFDEVQRLLTVAGIPFVVDPSIVRGLDYYTETVFEVQSNKLGAQSSLCGGGRYDHLIKELGGAPTPSVGVAMGIERALIVLEAENLLPEAIRPEFFIAYTGEDTRDEAFKIAFELRGAGHQTLLDVDGKSLKSQMGQANKAGARKVLIVGEEEMKTNSVTVKNLETGEQQSILRSALLHGIRSEPEAV
jgi:histidyl-tRNA synthetase